MPKPTAKLAEENGNIFNLMAIAKKSLKEAGTPEKANEMFQRIVSDSKSYDESLMIIMEYVDVE